MMPASLAFFQLMVVEHLGIGVGASYSNMDPDDIKKGQQNDRKKTFTIVVQGFSIWRTPDLHGFAIKGAEDMEELPSHNKHLCNRLSLLRCG